MGIKIHFFMLFTKAYASFYITRRKVLPLACFLQNNAAAMTDLISCTRQTKCQSGAI